MIVLPPNAVMVLQDEAPTEKKSLIITSEDIKPQKPNTGTIIFTAPELKQYSLQRIKFRPNFAEEVEFEDKKYLYFRDLNSSMYWILKDEDKN